MSHQDTAADVWMQVRSIGVDRTTRTVGAILARQDGDDLLFVPVDRAGAAAIAGARRAHSVEPGLALLCSVIASLGARLRHVVVAPDVPFGADRHLRVRTAELVLTDASKVRCDPAKAMALSVHAGVPVHVAGDVPRRLFVPAGQGRSRFTAAMSDPVERSVDELRSLLSRVQAADFDLPA